MKSFVVYRITNLKNGRVYIGSTNNFEIRKSEHFGQLRTNKHVNGKLQLDFRIYGVNAFVMEITKDGFENRQSMLLAEYELILKLKDDDYNIDKNCPVEGIHNPKNKKRNRKQRWKAHIKWLYSKKRPPRPSKIKIEHPALDAIAERKRQREKIQAL